MFTFLFLIPTIQAGMTFQPRYWREMPCIDFDGVSILCEPDITDYLDITYEEITPKKWHIEVKVKDLDALLEKYSLEDLQNLRDTVQNLTPNTKVSNAIFNPLDKSLSLDIEFIDEWRGGERFKIGYKSIVFDSVNNLITIVGDATCGNTEANACGFNDIYNEDLSNDTWKCIDANPSNISYEIGCKIEIGDGTTTTWFVDTNKQVVFNSTTVNQSYVKLIDVKANSHLRFGQVEDATDKLSSSGVSIHSADTSHTLTYLIYGSGSNANISIYRIG